MSLSRSKLKNCCQGAIFAVASLIASVRLVTILQTLYPRDQYPIYLFYLIMASLDEIKTLLEQQSQSVYNPESVPKLEACVAAQVSGQAPYYFDANRILVKLYSFYPETINDSVTAQILLLSLLEFPSTDLLALLCLVPNQTGEPTATIIR